jgi:hypothetical protein
MTPGRVTCVCAWCERVRTRDGAWEEADPALVVEGADTHGICPDCLVAETRGAFAGLEAR